MFPGGGAVSFCGAGIPQPKMDVALIGERVFGLAEIARRGERGFEVGAGARKITVVKSPVAQGKMSPDMLAQSEAFAAFPRLKTAVRDELAGEIVSPGLIVERAKFDGQIVAAAGEFRMPLEDVDHSMLRRSETTTICPYKGTASYWTVEVGEQQWPDAVWAYEDPLPEALQVKGYVSFLADGITVTT